MNDCAGSHDSCCCIGANCLLDPAQLVDTAGDGISSVAAVVMWRLLAGLEEGVGGLSGLGGLADSAEGR